jgi:hypothetical protein
MPCRGAKNAVPILNRRTALTTEYPLASLRAGTEESGMPSEFPRGFAGYTLAGSWEYRNVIFAQG